MPPEDVSRFLISVELPTGSSLDDTDRRTEDMRKIIEKVDGVDFGVHTQRIVTKGRS